jgi:hypothetical protein
MVRKKVKEPKVDTEIMYAYAKTNNLGELDTFMHGTHQANLQAVGDRWGGGGGGWLVGMVCVCVGGGGLVREGGWTPQAELRLQALTA